METKKHVGSGITLRVLFLAANPLDTENLSLDQEWRHLARELDRAPHSVEIELLPRFAVTATDLRHALLDTRPHVVHFSGHGGSDSIMLASEGDDSKPLSLEDLVETFRVLKDDVALFFLNACHSHTIAKEIVKVGVDFAIGMEGRLANPTALLLAVEFYKAIAFGRTVAQAFALSLLAIPADQRTVPRLENRADVHPEGYRLVGTDQRTVRAQKLGSGRVVQIDIQTASRADILLAITFHGIFEELPPGLSLELSNQFPTASSAIQLVMNARHLLLEHCPDEKPLPPAVVPMDNGQSAWSTIINRGVGFGPRALAAVLLCALEESGRGVLPLTEETLLRLIRVRR